MRTINRFAERPAALEVIPVGRRAWVYVRTNIRQETAFEEDGTERAEWTATEWSTQVNAGFEPDQDFIDKLVAFETAAEAARVRERRDALLDASDKEVLPDRDTDKAAWAAYRQSLRQIPEQEGFPFDVKWPIKPRQSRV